MQIYKIIPGRAMKASAWRAISAFLWCISDTVLTSPIGSPVICIICTPSIFSPFIYQLKRKTHYPSNSKNIRSNQSQINIIKRHCTWRKTIKKLLEVKYLSWHETLWDNPAKHTNVYNTNQYNIKSRNIKNPHPFFGYKICRSFNITSFTVKCVENVKRT